MRRRYFFGGGGGGGGTSENSEEGEARQSEEREGRMEEIFLLPSLHYVHMGVGREQSRERFICDVIIFLMRERK